MTGFGNFLYFDKKQDFTLERVCSMWLRINYFPLLLSWFVAIPLDLFYIVPLHTTAFVITMLTCLFSKTIYTKYSNTIGITKDQCNIIAIATCFIVHIVFYETNALYNILQTLFGYEIYFRFGADKYSAILGILTGYCWGYCTKFINWCYNNPNPTSSSIMASYTLRIVGVTLIVVWYMIWGYISDKHIYNPIHPIIFWMPVMGYLMLRNSSKYLTQIHSTTLEFFGKITLETYVLQFTIFMCNNVQNIPIVIPGAGKDGIPVVKFLNMLLCGTIFVAVAYWARHITVVTQTTVTELIHIIIGYYYNTTSSSESSTTLYTKNSNIVSNDDTATTTKLLDDDEDDDNVENKPLVSSNNGHHDIESSSSNLAHRTSSPNK